MPLDLQSHNSIAVVAFAMEDGYPRLTRRTLDELGRLLGQLRNERAFRGIAIAANSLSYATGADIEEIAPLKGVQARDFAERGQRLFNEISLYSLPVVAAIRGYCLGGGLDLALACHARVATYDSSFGHPGGALGLITGWGGTQRLPRLLGKPAGLQILLTGERIPATQAVTLGLVDELVSSHELLERAALRAERIATSMQAAG
jgi:enoyl-CoA hydratase